MSMLSLAPSPSHSCVLGVSNGNCCEPLASLSEQCAAHSTRHSATRKSRAQVALARRTGCAWWPATPLKHARPPRHVHKRNSRQHECALCAQRRHKRSSPKPSLTVVRCKCRPTSLAFVALSTPLHCGMLRSLLTRPSRGVADARRLFHACVVGAGPGGLYSAIELKRIGATRVDILVSRCCRRAMACSRLDAGSSRLSGASLGRRCISNCPM